MLDRTFGLVAALAALMLSLPDDRISESRNQADEAVASETEQESDKGAEASSEKKSDEQSPYDTAEKAWIVGAAFYNARDFESSREPLEAALKLAPDDEFRLKVYEALLPAYREIPEFDPFMTAAEFIITHSPRDARQSLTRRAFLSFAYNRGQIKNLIKRYEERISADNKDRTAVYILSEIYVNSDRNPKRAIELIQQLQVLDAESRKPGDTPEDPVQAARIAREKAKLAGQYLKSKEYEKSARLYEEIAPLDPATQAWNLKEAAAAWLKHGSKEEALRVALEADKSAPEARNDLLAHFFHRNLGDVLLAVGEASKAAAHFTIAIEKTTIDGYVKDTKASLQKAIDAQQEND